MTIDIGGGILLGVFFCRCVNTPERHLVVSKPQSSHFIFFIRFLTFIPFHLISFQKIMNIQIKYVLLLVTFAIAEKQIKLEDIERDNLLSERRVNRDEEGIKIDQSQHLGAPIHVRPQYQVMLKKFGRTSKMVK